MPRRRQPHNHEIRPVPFDPSTPFSDQVALYCRLSNDDPKSVSIEHQVERGTTYAKRHNKTVVAIYVDKQTGKDPDRLALAQLCRDAVAKQHSGVIFWDGTRLHRGIPGAWPVVRLHMDVPKYTFTAVDGQYDIDKIGYIAQQGMDELENTKRRSMQERRVRAENGEWMAGMKPYWLRRDPETKAAVIDEERAAVFLRALEIYALPTGSAWEACEYLTKYAPLAQRAGASQKWLTQRFRLALKNPALWGSLPYARGLEETERVDGLEITRKRVDNPEQVPFRVPPLIHEHDLERIQCELSGGCERDPYPTGQTLAKLMLTRDKRQGGRPWKVSHPLRQVRLLCACGWAVRWVVKRGPKEEQVYVYVDCAARGAKGRSFAGESCGLRMIPMEPSKRRLEGGGGMQPRIAPLWPRVREKLVAALCNPEALLAEQRQAVLAERGVEVESVAGEAERLAEIDATLEALQRRGDRLYEDYARDDIDRETFKRQKAVIDNDQRGHEQRKSEILARRLAAGRADEAVEKLRLALLELEEHPSEATDEHWSGILPELVESITVNRDGEPTIRWWRPSA